MNSHAGCRCSPVPERKVGAGMKSGKDWFDDLPKRRQEKIMHPKILAAYERGDVSWDDLFKRKRTPDGSYIRVPKGVREVTE